MKHLLSSKLHQYICILLVIIPALSCKVFAAKDNGTASISIRLAGNGEQVHSKPVTFRILTEEFPPYNYTNADGKIDGISTSIVREIIKRIGHPDNIEVVPWVEGYDITQKEDNTILFSTTRSPAREDFFKWVGPLVPNNTSFFAKKGSGVTISSLDDAKNVKSIGVYKDDFGELLLIEKGFTNLDSVVDNKLNPIKLVAGKIDLWIMNELTGKHMAMEAGVWHEIEKVFDVQKDYMYIAFSKSTPDYLIKKWKDTLDEIKADGTFAQIFSKWIMFSYSDAPQVSEILTEKEKRWLKDHPVINASFDPKWPPVEWIDEKGNYVGLTKDYFDLVQEKLGIRFNLIYSKSWSEVLEKAKNREIDMIIAAAQTPSRSEYMLFTKPYLNLPSVIITNTDTNGTLTMDDLKGKTVSVVDGFASHEFMQNNFPQIKLDPVTDTLTGLLKVSFGKTDAMVTNIAATSYYAEKAFISNLKVADEIGYTVNLSIASRKDWPELNIILRKGLAVISPSERQMIFQKWVAPHDDSWRLSKEFIITVSAIIGALFVGGILYWNIALKKIVERRTKELIISRNEAEAATLAKSYFLANMSHEIRTPLNSIVGFSQILLKDSENQALTEEFKQFLRNIKTSGENLSELINNILDLSKIEAGKTTVSMENLNLKLLVQGIFHTNKTQSIEKDIRFTYSYDPNLPEIIYSDRTKINQILMNLTNNAIKFTDAGKDVSLKVVREKDVIVFEVKDRGIGISPDRQTSIFKPFEQAESSTTRLYGGTGLGLSIVKSMVNLLKGEITLKSEEGKGSTFILKIPLVESDEELATEEMSGWNDINFSADNKILIVEDNTMNQQMLQALFKKLGLKVSIASDGASGIEMAISLKPDLIIMDMHMPKMDGLETTRRIRLNPECKDIPVIFLSADALSNRQKQVKDEGIADYLTKPLNINKLINVMVKYLRYEQGLLSKTLPDNASMPDEINTRLLDEFRTLSKIPYYLTGKISSQIKQMLTICKGYNSPYTEILRQVEEAAFAGNSKKANDLIAKALDCAKNSSQTTPPGYNSH
ncbi:MAG: transporter substrate-binding domain-containing protein [Candidatus Anammoxibacter sp.]